MEEKEDLSPQDLVKKFNKELGEDGVICLASEYEHRYTDRLNTGSVGLDIATSGGLPRGGVVQFIGKDSSGKSTMAFKVIKEVQKRFKDEKLVALASVEMKPDLDWAKACGVKLDDSLHLVFGSSAEEIFKRLIAMIKTRQYALIVLDSIPGLIPEEDSIDSHKPGSQAAIISKFIRIGIYGGIVADDTDNNTTVLVLNQYRSNIGGFAPFGMEALSVPGGKHLLHVKLLDVEFRSADRISEGTGDNQKIYGKQIKYRVLKAKAGCHEGGRGKIDLYTEPYGRFKPGDIDVIGELIIHGMIKDIITRGGRFYTLYDQKYSGKDELYSALEDPKLFEKLRRDVLSN